MKISLQVVYWHMLPRTLKEVKEAELGIGRWWIVTWLQTKKYLSLTPGNSWARWPFIIVSNCDKGSEPSYSHPPVTEWGILPGKIFTLVRQIPFVQGQLQERESILGHSQVGYNSVKKTLRVPTLKMLIY